MGLEWASHIHRQQLSTVWIKGRQVCGSSAIVLDPFHMPNRATHKQHLEQCSSHSYRLWSKTRSGFWSGCFSRARQVRECMCVVASDAGLSFYVESFCSTASVRLGLYLGHWWKGMGTKRGSLPYLKALSVSLGFQSVLSAERKMVVWNLLCRLYRIGRGGSLFFSWCLAQGRGVPSSRTLLYYVYLI